MGLNVGTLSAILDLDAKPFDQKLDRSTNGGLTGMQKAAVKTGVAVGGALIGAAGAGTLAFGNFEQRMNEVFTLLPDLTKKQMGEMTGDVKHFATEFGVLPDKVVPALYQAISAGVPQENVFKFLETAQKAAKGGVTDLETSVDGISSVVNAYGSDVIDAAKASDIMFTAVRMGKTNFEQLSASLFNVIPTAAGLGVKFGDVTAALATMTAQGVPTSVATTQIRQLLVELSKAGSHTADVFEKQAGKSFKQFIADGGSLQDALKIMEKTASGSGQTISDMFGSVEAGSAALTLTGKGTDKFTTNLAAMGDSAGATDKAFDRMNHGVNASLDKMKARASVVLIDIGQKLGPVAAGLGQVGASVGPLLVAFPALGASMGGVAASFGKMGMAFATNPWTLAVAGIAIAAILIVKHWDTIKEAIGKALDWIGGAASKVKDAGSAVVDWFAGIGNAIGGFFASAGEWLVDAGQKIIGGLLTGINAYFGLLKAFYIDLPLKILSYVASAGSWLVGVGGRIISGLYNGVRTVWSREVSFWSGLPGRIVRAFGNVGSLLYDIGRKVIRGLINGIGSMFGAVKNKLGDLTHKLVGWKGPPERDVMLLHGAGQLVMQGFVHGVESQFDQVRQVLARASALTASTSFASPFAAGVGGGSSRGGSPLAAGAGFGGPLIQVDKVEITEAGDGPKSAKALNQQLRALAYVLRF